MSSTKIARPSSEPDDDNAHADHRRQREGIGAEGAVSEGDADAVGTMASWFATAKDHGEEFQEDDWIALVQELARRAAVGQ